MIELDEFIQMTLLSIVRGIRGAQGDEQFGLFVAPMLRGEKRNDVGNFHLKDDTSRQATVIQFDVQVATQSTSQVDGRGGLKARLYVVDVDLGGSGSSTSGSATTHRLQFAIPVEIPNPRSRTPHTLA
jgi:hypothetical protein